MAAILSLADPTRANDIEAEATNRPGEFRPGSWTPAPSTWPAYTPRRSSGFPKTGDSPAVIVAVGLQRKKLLSWNRLKNPKVRLQ